MDKVTTGFILNSLIFCWHWLSCNWAKYLDTQPLQNTFFAQ